MIMDRADEGDTTRQLALDLIFSAVLFLPNRMALILGSMTKSCTKREMKWNDCSAGGRDLAGSSLASTSSILCFLLSCSLCLLSIRLGSVNKP